MIYPSISLVAALVATATAKTIVINVGTPALQFTPASTTAGVGDTLEFHFTNTFHNVVQGDFSTPCAPGSLASTGFDSGPSGPVSHLPQPKLKQLTSFQANVFQVTVKDTKPIFYYCAKPSHCQQGMVGVINPGTDTLEAYKAAAALTSSSSGGDKVQGGSVVAPGNKGPGGGGGGGGDDTTEHGTATSAVASGTTAAATTTKTEDNTTKTEHGSTKSDDNPKSTTSASGSAALASTTVTASTTSRPSPASTTSAPSSNSTSRASSSSAASSSASPVSTGGAQGMDVNGRTTLFGVVFGLAAIVALLT